MYSEEVIRDSVQSQARVFSGLKYSPFIIAALVLMAVALVYVWSHIRTTNLEYRIAEEIGIKENLLEEQRKLKVELATLKSPHRIEAIAKEKLHMTYPEKDQVIIIK